MGRYIQFHGLIRKTKDKNGYKLGYRAAKGVLSDSYSTKLIVEGRLECGISLLPLFMGRTKQSTEPSGSQKTP